MGYKEYRLVKWQPLEPGEHDHKYVAFRGANALPLDQVVRLNIKVRSEIHKLIRHARRSRFNRRNMPAQNVLVIHNAYGAEIWVSPETFDMLAGNFNVMMRALSGFMLKQLAAQPAATA